MAQNGNTELIREIKEKNDIVSVISEYVSLRRVGRSYSGLCPFHSEKTPSFNVNPAKQFFYCFGCGAGGDVISFLMKVENLDFIEAARRLADRVGITWPEYQPTAERRNRAELYRINKLAAFFFHQCLIKTESGKKARDYLEKRGISSEIWSKFYLGYAIPGWQNLTGVLRQKEIRLELADNLGLVGFGENGYYDRFRDRLIFPIFDPKGNVCGFGGRVFDDSHPKYLNSPDTALFHKGNNWFGLHLAKEAIRKHQRAIIVEGYMDVIQAHQAGFDYTVASLGTALTVEQVKIIKRYTSEVILAYDADTAGQNATLKGLEILRENGINVKILTLPEGHDPDSFIRTYGADEFGKLLEKVEDLVSFKIRNALARNDTRTPEGKAGAVREILPDLASLSSLIAREEYIRMISRQIGVSETSILQELRNWTVLQRKKSKLLDRNNENSYTKEIGEISHNTSQHAGLLNPKDLPPLQKAIFEVEKELLQSALQEYDKFARIKEKLNPDQLSFKVWREFWSDLLHQNPSDDNFQMILEGIRDTMRETAVTLMAEAEVKNLQSLDIDGMLHRLEMLRLQQKVQDLTKQISNGRDEKGNILSEADLKRKITEFTELKKKLQKNFPNFSAEI